MTLRAGARAGAVVDLFELDDGDRRYRITAARVGESQGAPALTLLLDGNQMFDRALELAGRDGPAQLIVGIGYEETDPDAIAARRWFELTDASPPHLTPTGYGRPWKTGGTALFAATLSERILPEILRRHETTEHRTTLFGHSLAGLFALRAFLSRALPVQRFVAADPSIWWNGGRFLQELAEMPADAFAGDGRELTILTAGREAAPPGDATSDVIRMKALSAGPNGADVARRLGEAGLQELSLIEMPDESHGSLIDPALREALHAAAA